MRRSHNCHSFLRVWVNDVFCIFLIFHILTASVPYLDIGSFEKHGMQAHWSSSSLLFSRPWEEKVRDGELIVRLCDICFPPLPFSGDIRMLAYHQGHTSNERSIWGFCGIGCDRWMDFKSRVLEVILGKLKYKLTIEGKLWRGGEGCKCSRCMAVVEWCHWQSRGKHPFLIFN